jgi:hypothetical protein
MLKGVKQLKDIIYYYIGGSTQQFYIFDIKINGICNFASIAQSVEHFVVNR